jgi:hypothetical protein
LPTIERGREMPVAGLARRGLPRSDLPFAKMQVGDSFWAPNWTTPKMNYQMRKARDAGLGDFTAQMEWRAGVRGVAVWRCA